MSDPIVDIALEQQNQLDRWGVQNHPSFGLSNFPYSITSHSVPLYFELPSEDRAKYLCNEAFKRGKGTFAHILVEEVAEVFEAFGDIKALRSKLVQVAAVCASWIDKLDRTGSIE